MHLRLNNFITEFDIPFTAQHGFKSGHSTFMSLLSMHDKISAAMDKNENPIGIFLDLAKTFDTIDHGILFKKIIYLWNSENPTKLVQKLFREQNEIS